MLPPTRRGTLLYVSDRPGRTDVSASTPSTRVLTRSTAALDAGTHVPTAEWVVVDADVLGPTPPDWLDSLAGDVYVLTSDDAPVPEWVETAGVRVLDSALVGLLAGVKTSVAETGGRVDGRSAPEEADSRTCSTVTDPEGDDLPHRSVTGRADGTDGPRWRTEPRESVQSPEATDAGGTGATERTDGADRADGADGSIGYGGADEQERERGRGRERERADGAAAVATEALLDGVDPLSAVPFPVALLDAEGVVRLVNPAWTQYSVENGRAPDAIGIGVNYLDACETDDDTSSAAAARALRRVIDGDSDGERVEYPVSRRGSKRWFSVRIVPLVDSDPIRAAVVHTDVSHYKQRINVLDRVLRHNLRNKANIILGHAAALASERDDETATAATTIGAAARELLSLSEQARRYWEVSSDDRPTTPIDVVAVVSEVTERVTERYPRAVVETSLPAVAVVQGTQSLSLVVHELVENAIVHSDRADPWVRVEVVRVHEDGDERISVRVADDGPGIPEQDRRLLTGGLEEHPIRHGSQLGVWVVSSLVTALDGKVSVEPNSPRGSVVVVTFPSVTVEE